MVLYEVSLPPQPELRDNVADEMSAMLAVGKAISALQDPEARLRVLRWANERFNRSDAMLPASAAFDAAPDVATDTSLSVDSLHSLFEPVTVPHGDNPHTGSWDDEIGDIFDEPIVRRAEPRVVAGSDEPIAVAHDTLDDLYDEPAVASRAQLDDPLAGVYDQHDLYEQQVAPNGSTPAAFENEPIEFDEPLALEPTVVHDDAVDLFDEPAALRLDEMPQVEEAPVPQEDAALPQDEKSLDALLTDLVTSLESLTAQFQDVTA